MATRESLGQNVLDLQQINQKPRVREQAKFSAPLSTSHQSIPEEKKQMPKMYQMLKDITCLVSQESQSRAAKQSQNLNTETELPLLYYLGVLFSG